MPKLKLSPRILDLLGILALFLAGVVLWAISHALCLSVLFFAVGATAEVRFDLYHRASYWWDRQRSRFGA
jgi:hypothetical protein